MIKVNVPVKQFSLKYGVSIPEPYHCKVCGELVDEFVPIFTKDYAGIQSVHGHQGKDDPCKSGVHTVFVPRTPDTIAKWRKYFG